MDKRGFFSHFFNGDKCSRDGERTKKVQCMHLSCARREHAHHAACPHSSLGSHSQQHALP